LQKLTDGAALQEAFSPAGSDENKDKQALTAPSYSVRALARPFRFNFLARITTIRSAGGALQNSTRGQGELRVALQCRFVRAFCKKA